MLDIVLSYAARGWSVIPLHSARDGHCSCRRPKCDKPGKHPVLPTWAEYQIRLATEEEVREWFTRWPEANLAIVTGRVSGLVVLDLDGPAAVQAARERGGLPPTPCVVTKRGYHYYLSHPGQKVKNAATLGGVKGLDVRGDGGYAVAPPSVHPSGRQYTWAKGRSPDDLPLAPCPGWLVELLADRDQAANPEPGREPGWVEQLLAGVPEGQRDDACTRLAGHYLGKGLPESEVIMLLLAWNRRNQPPLPEKDIEKCVRSVAGREARKPNRTRAQVSPGGFRLEGPVYAPEGWRTLVICRNWAEARKLAFQGNAVVVARRDGTLPPEAGRLIATAQDVKTAGFTQEEARRLAWELYPLRLVSRAATEGTAALKPEPAEVELEAPEPEPAQEPEPEPELAVPLPSAPEPGLAENRFLVECWLNQHRPNLLQRIRAAEEEAERMYWYAQVGFPEKLREAEAALAQAVAAGQQAMREALAAGREEAKEAERELTFEEVERVFGGFVRVWNLTDAQVAYLEKIFHWKGPVVVRSENGLWWSADDWRS